MLGTPVFDVHYNFFCIINSQDASLSVQRHAPNADDEMETAPNPQKRPDRTVI